jgi:NAD(P)-dependent dehydrogenase (short-subunit alcohol dehydrogenase family)
MKQKLLEDKIVVVTGASRGIGKGIATQLGKHGATVYVTGRTLSTSSNASSGTIDGVAEEVTAAGGKESRSLAIILTTTRFVHCSRV